MRLRLAVLISVLAVVVASCTDQPSPTTPPRHLLASISDGAHSGGNPNFFFLPPLVANPVGNPNFKSGTFNPHLLPVVRVFLLPTDCNLTSAPVFGPVVAALDAGGEQYHVNWDTKASNLAAGANYRVCVFSSLTGEELGFLDVAPVAGGMKKLATNDTYAFQDDRTLPIKVRIQQGALCANPQDCTEFTVTSAGGDFTLPSKFAGLSVPAGAVHSGDIVTVVVEEETPQFTGECLPTEFVQSKGCYHFRSEPALYQFAILVRMEACVDAQFLGEGQLAALRLFKYNTTQGLVELPQATPTLIDCTNFVALANLDASRPTSFAAAALRGLGRWAGRLLSPPPLYASMHGPVPTGLGGLGGSFSDVGGAVPAEEGSPDLTIDGGPLSWPEAPQNGSTFNVKVKNIGQASTGPTPFYVGLALYRVVEDVPDSLGAVWSLVSNPLLPGETRTIQLTIPCSWYSVFGYYFVKAVADFTLIVADPNRENNTMESPWLQLGSAGSGYCGS